MIMTFHNKDGTQFLFSVKNFQEFKKIHEKIKDWNTQSKEEEPRKAPEIKPDSLNG